MLANSGRSGQPVHSPEGRAGTLAASALAGRSGTSTTVFGDGGSSRQQVAGVLGQEALDALQHHGARVFTRHRQRALADDARRTAAGGQHRADRLFDELGLTFLDHEHGALALGELTHLLRQQRIRDIQDVDRHLRRP